MSEPLKELAIKVIGEADIVAVAALHLGGRPHPSSQLPSYNCVFHADDDASMHVSAVRQVFNCAVCGAHGSVIDLVMRIRGTNFEAAVREIGHLYAGARQV